MYQKEVSKLVKEVSKDLRLSSTSFYRIGIDVFHQSRMKSWGDFQPAIANLSISVELLLKSLIAKKAIRMLYANIPDEAQLLLCYPESLSKEHNSKSYLGDLKGFVFKTIELDKCISLFYHFFPDSKQEYKQFFSSLSTVRNLSVHASVPEFQRYELERIAYFSTSLFQFVSKSKVFGNFIFKVEKTTENFLKNYEDEKIKKVKNALKTAKDIVKTGQLSKPEEYSPDWDTMETVCPICESNAVFSGETEESFDEDGLRLEFLCESFSCESCGLELGDYEELSLASLETSIDREGEDIEEWLLENGYYDEDDRW